MFHLETEAMCRPRLLLGEEFRGAEIAAGKLRQLFPETDVSILAEKAPLLLVEDVEDIVADLRRYKFALSFICQAASTSKGLHDVLAF